MARVGVSKGRHGVSLEPLSQKWLVSPLAARRTVHHTTLRGIRKILHPYLSCQLKKLPIDEVKQAAAQIIHQQNAGS